MSNFTPESLVTAVTQLFELNHYSVAGPQKVNGAEVDLIATRKADPFARKIYLEVTIEYVDNNKYGKDVGKLAMIGEVDRDADRLIISSSGFSLPVKERARATRIETLTYDELFKRFEKFDTYVDAYSEKTETGREVATLSEIYEPPNFEDKLGSELAVDYLTAWKNASTPEQRWLIVTGEYGTGKTALTRVLQYRWLEEYKQNPALPIPFRIELRNFTRQFDARGLLHHFLDRNRLSHISVDFIESLVRTGRVVLILDGYDEMAQFFNSRERRQCLEALASLSAEGAKGLITSRPNYFTLSEELQIFETLYSSIKTSQYISASTRAFIEREETVDRLLEKFLDRFERNLRDLTPGQTTALVTRILGDDSQGLKTIQLILAKIFRNQDGGSVSLSGKPVIVSYLLEVVEQLKQSKSPDLDIASLTEWQVYRLIVDQLMLRDLARSPDINPEARRRFLQRLAIFLSRQEHEVIGEQDFRDLVSSEFKREINRLVGDAKSEALSRFFSDLRSSTTLTRATTTSLEGWRFSHNSLREFLIAEYFESQLLAGSLVNERVQISDAMRTFAASISRQRVDQLLPLLQSAWRNTAYDGATRGQALCLFWDAFVKHLSGDSDRTRSLLQRFAAVGEGLEGLVLSRLVLSSSESRSRLTGLKLSKINLSNIQLSGADISGAEITDSVLDSVDFSGANLSGTDFSRTLLFDVNLSNANLVGAVFKGVPIDSTSLTIFSGEWPHTKRLDGSFAIGYLRYSGAETDEVSDYHVLHNHPRFEIVEKIVTNLSKQAHRQRRGLEQRGAAHADVPFAQNFVAHLLAKELVEVPKNRKELLDPTERGRQVFQDFVGGQVIAPELVEFLRAN
jgi:uncharacterized protein YjbI with pentapeptide repeats/Cdc6-like AAA superfamily ATPase